jgi:hypothetical protein
MDKITNLNEYRCDKHYEDHGDCQGCEFVNDNIDDEYCKLGLAVLVGEVAELEDVYE